MHMGNYKIQGSMSDKIAYMYKSYPDNIYLSQEIHEPDIKDFINYSVREINSHCN